jgi:hypothetical protein
MPFPAVATPVSAPAHPSAGWFSLGSANDPGAIKLAPAQVDRRTVSRAADHVARPHRIEHPTGQTGLECRFVGQDVERGPRSTTSDRRLGCRQEHRTHSVGAALWFGTTKRLHRGPITKQLTASTHPESASCSTGLLATLAMSRVCATPTSPMFAAEAHAGSSSNIRTTCIRPLTFSESMPARPADRRRQRVWRPAATRSAVGDVRG